MSDLKIYGIAQSRAMRVLWCAEELGLDYEHIPTNFKGETKEPEFLAINPNGRVPAIEDEHVTMFESLAINLYLVRKHGGPLSPASIADEARTTAWSFWVMTEVEKPLLTAMFHNTGMMGFEKDETKVAAAMKELDRPLKVLNDALDGKDYLLDGSFTVADLNVASILAWGKMTKLDFSPYPNLVAWLDRCLAREAFQKVKDM